ncbi:toll/interleukin-1 receptor domain-containing protein [Candidatus Entotheonella palauensis]|uniref:toll/interleukin-1 receptor domain-containing protein n=1 Tax=Candidatus Entotheonella palauensis TaxID=93172 RepID=UPI000B7DFC94|nr:toll/interleukin-1 receptor domain-containing protein [Candidatus Entotheonella palauensis]
MASPETISNKIFISYSPQDAEWAERLRVHLKPLDRSLGIMLWEAPKIAYSRDWPKTMAESIRTSKVAIMLISADDLATTHLMEQDMTLILAVAERQELKVFPIIIRPSL